MVTKTTVLTLSVVFCVGVFLNASVTIQINAGPWGDNTSSAVNGMAWGLVVDSDGAAAGGDFTGSFESDLASNLNGFTLPGITDPSDPVTLFNEYRFVRSQANTVTGPPPEDSDGWINTIQFNLTSPVTAGDDYGLVWFSIGTGTLSTSDFFGFQDIGVLPADGQTITASTTPTQGSLAVVPEPSTFALLAGLFGFAWVCVRRRR